MAQLLRSLRTLKTFTYLSSNNVTTNKNFLSRCFHKTVDLKKVVTFNLSDIGEGIHEVTVKEWFVKTGDVVEQFDKICEVQSDKASVTITSKYDGKIVKLHHMIDEIALVGKPLLNFDVVDEDDTEQSSCDEVVGLTSLSKFSEKEKSVDSSVKPLHKVLTTPAVRRISKEKNVVLSSVQATGRNGRILKGDILEHLNLIPKGSNKQHPSNIQANTQSKTFMKDEIVPLKGVAKAMYKSMSEALKIPHFAYSDEIDITKLVQVREEIKAEALERDGIRLTYMPFFIKAASVALNRFPILNSSFIEETESILYHSTQNISIAMDSPAGLVVPNIKNVQLKSIIDIAKELNQLQEKGKSGNLTPLDFANGTFSLSNIGVIGGTYTHPVIMKPQVAIGAIGKTKIVPRFAAKDDSIIVKAHVIHVSFSADHRIIDGVTMARFTNLWKKYLENPNLFLLDGH